MVAAVLGGSDLMESTPIKLISCLSQELIESVDG